MYYISMDHWTKRNYIANALELRLSGTNPLKYFHLFLMIFACFTWSDVIQRAHHITQYVTILQSLANRYHMAYYDM